MAYSQTDIDNIVDEIVNQYNGQTVTYFGSFTGDSIAPVAYYVDKLRGTSPPPPMANNRADGWGIDFPNALASIFIHEVYRAGKNYPKGTILIWDTPHIAIVLTSSDSNIVEVFEQTPEPEQTACGIRERIVNGQRRTCIYALVPIVAVPETLVQPETEHYTVPVVPPYKAPMGALQVPVKEQRVYIRNTVLKFSAYTKAIKHEDAIGTYPAGNYYIYRQTGGMMNITKVQGTIGFWINPADNREYGSIKS